MEETIGNTIVELGKYGVVGVILALIILVAFMFYLFWKFACNHVQHSNDIFTEVKEAMVMLGEIIKNK